jgi:hypothetical protein
MLSTEHTLLLLSGGQINMVGLGRFKLAQSVRLLPQAIRLFPSPRLHNQQTRLSSWLPIVT